MLDQYDSMYNNRTARVPRYRHQRYLGGRAMSCGPTLLRQYQYLCPSHRMRVEPPLRFHGFRLRRVRTLR